MPTPMLGSMTIWTVETAAGVSVVSGVVVEAPLAAAAALSFFAFFFLDLADGSGMGSGAGGAREGPEAKIESMSDRSTAALALVAAGGGGAAALLDVILVLGAAGADGAFLLALMETSLGMVEGGGRRTEQQGIRLLFAACLPNFDAQAESQNATLHVYFSPFKRPCSGEG